MLKTSMSVSDFLSDDLCRDKSDEINALMDRGIKQNRTTFPVACFHFQSYNFTRNSDEKIPAMIILVILFALPLPLHKKKIYSDVFQRISPCRI